MTNTCKRCNALKEDHIKPFDSPGPLKCPRTEGGTYTDQELHIVPYDSPYLTVKFPRHARAMCGKLITIKYEMDNVDPTCEICKRMDEEEEKNSPGWVREEGGSK